VVTAQDFEWITQFGSVAPGARDDVGHVDVEGNVYVVGYTYGTLPGQTSAGHADAYVRKYDTDRNEVWTRQFGTPALEWAWELSVDPTGVYVAGFTYGILPGQTGDGGVDAFVRKYDFDGNEVWTRQFGTSTGDASTGVSVDSTGVYVAGSTWGSFAGYTNQGERDVFVRKYSANGDEVWTRQFGTVGWDQADEVAVYSGSVYIFGTTGVSPYEACDIFVCRYDTDGNQIWTRQFGSVAVDWAADISVDGTGVYLIGVTQGTLPDQASAGSWDAFVRKYDADGDVVWTRQFGTSDIDFGLGISVHPSGVYVAGGTYGTLPSQTSAGDADGYVRRYDVDGTELWTHQFGSSALDAAQGISVDATGVYVCGCTYGTLPGQTSAGNLDAFVAKLRITDDPKELLLVLIKVVSGLNLHQGIHNSLDAKLERAQQALEDLNQNNDISAINALEAFINEVEAQRGNKIPEADADAIVALAREVLELLTGGGAQSAQGGSLTATCILFQNSPNPCREFTTVNYQLPMSGYTTLTIYDATGRVVETLVDAKLAAGSHQATWETNEVPSGVYFYKLTSGSVSATRKVLILR